RDGAVEAQFFRAKHEHQRSSANDARRRAALPFTWRFQRRRFVGHPPVLQADGVADLVRRRGDDARRSFVSLRPAFTRGCTKAGGQTDAGAGRVVVMRSTAGVMFLIALIGSNAALAVQPDEILKDPALEARARDLSRELRCMVCQNQSIDDSEAPLAR